MINNILKIIQINVDIIKQIIYILINKKCYAIQKVIGFSIIGNNKHQSYTSQSYPINNEINNCEKNFSEVNILYPGEISEIKTNTDNMPKSLINNRTKKINFKKFKKHIYDLQANNEVKVFKNKKIVYVNKKLLNSYSVLRSIKKFGKINFITTKKRSSKYRGVSKNGNKWQVLIMINNKNCYLGNYSSEVLAARIYDIQAIKTWGIKAKTNFVYNNEEIKKIYNKEINISDIMAKLNN